MTGAKKFHKASLGTDEAEEDRAGRRLLLSPSSRKFCVIGVLTLLTLLLCGCSFAFYDTDVKNCRMSYMSPSYVDLDFTHPKFLNYELYRYKERRLNNFDAVPSGYPVLFIPGNAGSHRQVRAIAAEAAATRPLDDDNDINSRGLDFYTASFGEELAAFDGRSLENQAEYLNDALDYILSLYAPETRPKTVVLIGHSMGGVVARTMMTLENYQPGVVNTILTLAAPHAAPPASTDKYLVSLYDRVNRYWKTGFGEYGDLADMTLVSIAGGGLDRTIASELTSISALVPPSNGFTVYTSSIPFVWSAIDHQAIVWCDQFRIAVVKALRGCFEQGGDRMAIFRREFLGDFHKVNNNSKNNDSAADTLLIYQTSNIQITDNIDLSTRSRDDISVYMMPLTNQSSNFAILSDTRPLGVGESNMDDGLFVLACTQGEHDVAGHSSLTVLDTVGKDGFIHGLVCKNLSPDVQIVPKADSNVALAYPDERNSLFYLNFDNTHVQGYLDQGYLVVVDNRYNTGAKSIMTLGEQTSQLKTVVHDGLLKLGVWGRRIKLSPQLLTEVELENVWSSLISLDLTVTAKGGNHTRFQPFIRQYVDEPYESKYFLNVGDETVRINVHGAAPFVERVYTGDLALPTVKFQVWTDEQVELHVKINWFASAGRLVLHYRVAVVIFPLAIVAMCLLQQFIEYELTGQFVSFYDAWLVFVENYMAYLNGISAVLPLILGNHTVASTLQQITGSTMQLHFLGLEGRHMWILGPLFVNVATGVSLVYATVAELLVRGVAYLPLEWTRGAVSHLLLAGLITLLTIVPYQAVLIGTCVVQLLAAGRSRTASEQRYNVSLLILLFCILPVAMPTAAIWYGSDQQQHPISNILSNIWSLLPIHFCIAVNDTGLPTRSLMSKWELVTFSSVLSGLLVSTTFCTFIFGIQRAYWMHQLGNMVFGWLGIWQLRGFMMMTTLNYNPAVEPDNDGNEKKNKHEYENDQKDAE